jgi:hypothetical protein
MAKELINGLTVENISESIKATKNRDTANIIGLTGDTMKANGTMERETDMVKSCIQTG